MENEIEILCRDKERRLLDKYFNNEIQIHNVSKTLSAYTLDLPIKIEAEFREYLEKLWKRYSDTPLVLEEQELRRLLTKSKREALDLAYANAQKITLWERISQSNHSDVASYIALLHEYTQELLMIMRLDFLEEITGKHIKCKSFKDD